MLRLAMRTTVIVLLVLVAFTGVVALAPAANAAPPNIGGDGCGYFHWHNGDIKSGVAPGYHYHHCY